MGGFRLVAAGFAQCMLDHRFLPLGEVAGAGRNAESDIGRVTAVRMEIIGGGGLGRRGLGEREMVGVQDRAAAPEHRTLDHVTELAHVAGPRVGEQQRTGAGTELSHILAVFGPELVQELLGE